MVLVKMDIMMDLDLEPINLKPIEPIEIDLKGFEDIEFKPLTPIDLKGFNDRVRTP